MTDAPMLFRDLPSRAVKRPLPVDPVALMALRPAGGFGVLLGDPPWLFANWSEEGEAKNPNQIYDCMETDDICDMPVSALLADNAAMWLWGTSPMLMDCIRVMAAWGCTYKGFVPWVKQTKDGKGLAFDRGYWYRGAAEIVLFGTRGSPRRAKVPGAASVRNVIMAPRREHSRKPDHLHRTAELWFPNAQKLELFGRARRRGWTVFGNDLDKFPETT